MLSDSLNYQTVYDATSAHTTLWLFLWIAIVVGTLVLTRKLRQNGLETVEIGKIVFGTCVLLAFVSPVMLYDYRMARAIRSGRFTLVEGVVANLQPSNGHVEESWEVESKRQVHRFHYLDDNITPGFRNTEYNGGPIRAGLHVRIAEVDGHIARLEIATQ